MASQTLTIQVTFDEASMAALKALTDALTNGTAEPAETKAATKPKADPKPKAETKPADKPAETKPAEVKKPAVDREAIRAELKKLGALEGQAPALEILKKFGAATMGALKEEDFEACLAAVQAALKTAEERKNAPAADPLED